MSSEVVSILVDRSLKELAHLMGMARQEMVEEGMYKLGMAVEEELLEMLGDKEKSGIVVVKYCEDKLIRYV